MPTKRYSTEQIVSKLRQGEVELRLTLALPRLPSLEQTVPTIRDPVPQDVTAHPFDQLATNGPRFQDRSRRGRASLAGQCQTSASHRFVRPVGLRGLSDEEDARGRRTLG